jgi:hypothetical protein
MEEYLTITELSARLKIKPKTVKNKMAAGIFRRGVHYFSPAGLGPRFKWSAVVAWLEQSSELEMLAPTTPQSSENKGGDPVPHKNRVNRIPMARGYMLGPS